MKKVIIGLLVLVTAAVAVVFYLANNLDDLVKAAIEKYGSEATKTLVQVDRVKVSLKEGSAGIYGLAVGNPEGFEEPNVFALGEISTKIDYESVSKEIVIIDDIQVLSPQVFFEISQDNKLNLNELKKNLMSGQSSPSVSEKESEPAGGKPVKMIIRHLKFAEGDVSARIGPLNKTYNLTLPVLELKELGAPNGATPDEIARQVVNSLVEQVKVAVKKEGFYQEFENLKSQAKQKLDEEKSRLKNEAKGKVESEKERVKDQLKGLFDKAKF